MARVDFGGTLETKLLVVEGLEAAFDACVHPHIEVERLAETVAPEDFLWCNVCGAVKVGKPSSPWVKPHWSVVLVRALVEGK